MPLYEDEYKQMFGGLSFSGYAKQQQEDDEEKQKKALAEFNSKQNEAQGKNADGTDKSFGEKAIDLGKGIVGSGQRAATTAAQGVAALGTGAAIGIHAATGNEKGIKADTEQFKKFMDDSTNAKAIDGQPLSFISKKTQTGENNVAQFGAEFAKAGADTAAFVQPELKAASVGKMIGSEVGINATTTGVASAADQYSKTGKIDAGKTLQDATTGGIIGGVMRGGRVVGGKLLGKGDKTTTNTADGSVNSDVKQIGAGFKEDSHYDAEMQRFQRSEFTPEDNVWKDNVVKTEDGSTVDVTGTALQMRKNQIAIRDLQSQADGVDLNTGKTNVPEGADPSTYTGDTMGRANAADEVAKLEAQNVELKSQLDKAGVINESSALQLDPSKVKESFVSLKNEASQAKEYNFNTARDSYLSEVGDTVETAQAKLDAFDNGEMPDSVMKQNEPVAGAQDVFAHSNVPQEMKSVASEILDDRGDAEAVMSGLMNDKKYKSSYKAMDAAYLKRQEAIKEMPEPRQEIEMEKLTNKYLDDIDELETARGEDAADVEKYQVVLDHLDSKERQLTYDVNQAIKNNPESFKNADETLAGAEREKLIENLELAKTYNEPARIIENVNESGVDIVEAAKTTPAVASAVNAKVANDTITEGFKNSGGTRRALLTFMSDSKNLASMGMRKLHTDILRAEQTVVDVTKADMQLIKSVKDSIDNGDITNEQIIDFTQGKNVTIDNPQTAELVQKLLGDKADIIRKTVYDDTLASLKKGNSKLKKPRTTRDMMDMATEKANKATIDAYFPHIDLDSTTSQFARAANDGKNAGDVSFGNLKHRDKNSDQYSKDVVSVLSAYVTGFNKKFYLEPALTPLKDPAVRAKMHEAEAKYVDGYISKVLNRDTGNVEATVNMMFEAVNAKVGRQSSGNQYRKLLGAQRMISAVAGLGGNVASTLRQMTQQTNTVLAIGSENTLVGSKRFMDSVIEYKRTGKRPPELQDAVDSGVFDISAIASLGDELEMIIQGSSRTGLKHKAQKGGEILMSGIKYTDMFMRGQAYMGALRMGEKKGLTGQALKDFAAEKVVDTQFITSRIDMPKALNGPGMRSLSQFATFSIKQAEFLADYGFKSVKKKNGEWTLEDPAQFGRLIQASIVGAGFTAALAPIGFQADEWVPFGRDIAEGDAYKSPLVRLIAGDKGKVGLISLIYPAEITDPETGRKRKMTPDESAQKFWEDNWQNIIPAGGQIKKSSEGTQTTQSGVAKNPDGKIQFLQGNSGMDKLGGSLFGKYSTAEGKRWIQQDFPTLSETEMRLGQTKEEAADSGVTLESLNREQQQEWYNFYEAKKQAPSRSSSLDAIKKAAESGNENRVAKLTSEYNQSVKDAISQLYPSADAMPDDIYEQYTKLLIDPEKY